MSTFDPKELKPGTLMRQNKGTAAATLKERKEDDTGWWVVGGGGLGDSVITDETAGWTPDLLSTIAALQSENADLRASIGDQQEAIGQSDAYIESLKSERDGLEKTNHWNADGALVIEEKTLFRHVGWLGFSGLFYGVDDKPINFEGGGFAPLYVQAAKWVDGEGWDD